MIVFYRGSHRLKKDRSKSHRQRSVHVVTCEYLYKQTFIIYYRNKFTLQYSAGLYRKSQKQQNISVQLTETVKHFCFIFGK